ncbi:glycoside hydrolase family 75 protein [Streptomyces glaucescens]|uniref:glycoside hydrolase family 75 protein n=1 Tax=Streptomyces glaucescens TaxID=1907 RepID=UPI003F5496E1
MRLQSLTLVAAGAALLAPTALPGSGAAAPAAPAAPVSPAGPVPPAAPPGPAHPVAPAAAARPAAPAAHGAPVAGPAGTRAEPAAARERAVRAADLLARARNCVPVSRGRYRSDAGAPADIAVCGTRDAVFWKADMDIDCDGRPGRRCNRRTDPSFSAVTAFTGSDGRRPDAERLPYVVVPAPSRVWDHRAHGVRGGSVAAIVYRDRVRYAVVGDVGPGHIIGEASYAAAAGLGIDPDPRGGGTAAGVTYIVFKDSGKSPVESHAAVAAAGERLAREWVGTAARPAPARPAHDPAPDGHRTAGRPSPEGSPTPLTSLASSRATRTRAAACSPGSAALPVPAACATRAAGR